MKRHSLSLPKKTHDLKDKFNVSVEKGDDNKWRVTDFDID